MIRNPDTQVAECCRAAIRYLVSNDLKVGDKLPPQDTLRKELGFCHNSMTPAMNMLVESGMIERKTRLGTLVKDINAIPAGLWRIALPFGLLDGSAGNQFESLLVRYLQEKCQKAHCHIRYYLLSSDKVGVTPHALADFEMLWNDIESGLIDGVLTPAFFSAEASDLAADYNVPLCNVGGWRQTPIRIELDTIDFLTKALEILQAKGMRDINIVFDTQDNEELLGKMGLLQQDSRFKDLTISPVNLKDFNGAAGMAEYFQSKPTAERPAGLVIFNDVFALELTTRLNAFDYQPEMVIQSNKQIQLFYPTPVTRLEYDIEELADVGVNMLLNKILRHNVDDEVKSIQARLDG